MIEPLGDHALLLMIFQFGLLLLVARALGDIGQVTLAAGMIAPLIEVVVRRRPGACGPAPCLRRHGR